MTTGYAFVNAEMVVVNVIGGDIAPQVLEAFERDYAILFGSEFSVPVLDGTIAWVGGRYNPDDGTFSPPESQQEEIVP